MSDPASKDEKALRAEIDADLVRLHALETESSQWMQIARRRQKLLQRLQEYDSDLRELCCGNPTGS
jgi:hypothetical protein